MGYGGAQTYLCCQPITLCQHGSRVAYTRWSTTHQTRVVHKLGGDFSDRDFVRHATMARQSSDTAIRKMLQNHSRRDQ